MKARSKQSRRPTRKADSRRVKLRVEPSALALHGLQDDEIVLRLRRTPAGRRASDGEVLAAVQCFVGAPLYGLKLTPEAALERILGRDADVSPQQEMERVLAHASATSFKRAPRDAKMSRRKKGGWLARIFEAFR